MTKKRHDMNINDLGRCLAGGVLAVSLSAAVVGVGSGPASAADSVDCVAGPGVTQTATTVTGSALNDTIDCTSASPGKTIDSGPGNDTVTGTDLADSIVGGEGDDTLTGGAEDDVLNGDAGNDTITGSAGDDVLDGGVGIDTVSGGIGDDVLTGLNDDGVSDTLNGDAGYDDCGLPGLDLDTVTGCEIGALPVLVECVVTIGVTVTDTTVTGTDGNDTIDCSGALAARTIVGGLGNDTITGTDFADTIRGAGGNDTMTGLGGDDDMTGGDGNNTMTGGAGDDTMSAGDGNDTMTGSAGDDTLQGGTGENTLTP
jgi:Ca2+-binding RTX toxin-like protein